MYANRSKVHGINLKDPAVKQEIYDQYLKAYKKGVFNYIKEDINAVSGQPMPRKYFSGGIRNGAAGHPQRGLLTLANERVLAGSIHDPLVNIATSEAPGAAMTTVPINDKNNQVIGSMKIEGNDLVSSPLTSNSRMEEYFEAVSKFAHDKADELGYAVTLEEQSWRSQFAKYLVRTQAGNTVKRIQRGVYVVEPASRAMTTMELGGLFAQKLRWYDIRLVLQNLHSAGEFSLQQGNNKKGLRADITLYDNIENSRYQLITEALAKRMPQQWGFKYTLENGSAQWSINSNSLQDFINWTQLNEVEIREQLERFLDDPHNVLTHEESGAIHNLMLMVRKPNVQLSDEQRGILLAFGFMDSVGVIPEAVKNAMEAINASKAMTVDDILGAQYGNVDELSGQVQQSNVEMFRRWEENLKTTRQSAHLPEASTSLITDSQEVQAIWHAQHGPASWFTPVVNSSGHYRLTPLSRKENGGNTIAQAILIKVVVPQGTAYIMLPKIGYWTGAMPTTESVLPSLAMVGRVELSQLSSSEQRLAAWRKFVADFKIASSGSRTIEEANNLGIKYVIVGGPWGLHVTQVLSMKDDGSLVLVHQAKQLNNEGSQNYTIHNVTYTFNQEATSVQGEVVIQGRGLRKSSAPIQVNASNVSGKVTSVEFNGSQLTIHGEGPLFDKYGAKELPSTLPFVSFSPNLDVNVMAFDQDSLENIVTTPEEEIIPGVKVRVSKRYDPESKDAKTLATIVFILENVVIRKVYERPLAESASNLQRIVAEIIRKHQHSVMADTVANFELDDQSRAMTASQKAADFLILAGLYDLIWSQRGVEGHEIVVEENPHGFNIMNPHFADILADYGIVKAETYPDLPNGFILQFDPEVFRYLSNAKSGPLSAAMISVQDFLKDPDRSKALMKMKSVEIRQLQAVLRAELLQFPTDRELVLASQAINQHLDRINSLATLFLKATPEQQVDDLKDVPVGFVGQLRHRLNIILKRAPKNEKDPIRRALNIAYQQLQKKTASVSAAMITGLVENIAFVLMRTDSDSISVKFESDGWTVDLDGYWPDELDDRHIARILEDRLKALLNTQGGRDLTSQEVESLIQERMSVDANSAMITYPTRLDENNPYREFQPEDIVELADEFSYYFEHLTEPYKTNTSSLVRNLRAVSESLSSSNDDMGSFFQGNNWFLSSFRRAHATKSVPMVFHFIREGAQEMIASLISPETKELKRKLIELQAFIDRLYEIAKIYSLRENIKDFSPPQMARVDAMLGGKYSFDIQEIPAREHVIDHDSPELGSFHKPTQSLWRLKIKKRKSKEEPSQMILRNYINQEPTVVPEIDATGQIIALGLFNSKKEANQARTRFLDYLSFVQEEYKEMQRAASKAEAFSAAMTNIPKQPVTIRASQRTYSSIAAAKRLRGDRASLTKVMEEPGLKGGIDLNTSGGMRWKINKEGDGVEMNMSPAMIARIRRDGVDLTPEILSITSIASIWPLVGLQAPVK